MVFKVCIFKKDIIRIWSDAYCILKYLPQLIITCEFFLSLSTKISSISKDLYVVWKTCTFLLKKQINEQK